MKKSHNSSIPQLSSEHGRRDFLSLSLLAGSTLVLSTERHGYAQANKNDDVAIMNEVSAGDSVAIYTNLLDEVRRLVLRKDAETILVSKIQATDWLDRVMSRQIDCGQLFRKVQLLLPKTKWTFVICCLRWLMEGETYARP